ncbi:MAG TPA: two-component regulator propeller domain-containing protein [Longimicrobiales bacterium]
MRRAPVGALVLLLLCVAVTADARAQERLVRRFATEEGLGAPPVSALAQDRSNTLWIGTKGGLYRFDGTVFRRWASDRVTGAVARIAAAADGRVAAQTEDGAVFTLTRNGATAVPPPPGGWSKRVRALAYDGSGGLWSVAGDTALARRDEKGWTVLPRSWHGEERLRVILSAADGGILVLTDAGLWHLDPAGGPGRKRFDALLVDAVSFPDGRLVVLTGDGRVVELVEGRQRELASRARGHLPAGRPIMLVERAGTYWVAMDRYLVAVRPGAEVEWIGSADGLESGGPLLVDHEGSLWVGTFAALLQYPEPETVVWTDRAGLPGRHVRYLARSRDVLWVTSWQGTGSVRRAGTRLDIAAVPELSSQSRPCADHLGVLWLSVGGHAVRIHGGRRLGAVSAVPAGFNSCAAAPGPTLWIGSDRGLLRADVRRPALRRVEGVPFGDDAPVHAVLEDRAGRLWAASGERVCYAPAAAARAGDAGGWACELLPGAGVVTSLLELEDGGLWASTQQAGVLARGAEGWVPLSRNAELASRDVFGLVPSPSGGVWIIGSGILQRVRPGGPGGWEVLEAPGSANGLLSVGGGDLLEDGDGTLWVATSRGLLHVPPEARYFRPGAPPRVELMEARVDGEVVALGGDLELPADRNRLELRFAALSFRDPERVRYQVRLSPGAPWIDTRGQPWFRWVELPAGRYRAEVRASLDGRHWSAEPARFAFRVLPPWYRTPAALAGFATIIAVAVWAVYRARLAYLLGLERERTRIALDLHDELGSGLGSIGILAGLLAPGRLDRSQQSQIAEEVAGTAEELGSALADIVWALDPRTATLEELASRLVAHGERLFAGDDVEFRLRSPREWPATELPLALRRNVLLIGLEALHNAARHARARRVVLAFTRRGGRRWELTVSDDGVGLDHAEPCDARRGRGLDGMRRRAEEIGATIAWRTDPGGGTTVALTFAIPGAAARRLSRWRGRRRPRPTA